jgi:hypothetical protein
MGLLMLAASAAFRCFLVFVIALWTPVCLCRTSPGPAPAPPHEHVSAEALAHTCCRDPGDEHRSGDDRSGHDRHGTGCECHRLTATLVKAQASQWACAAPILIVVAGDRDAALAPFPRRFVGRGRLEGPVGRPPTSLLRLHCALVV